jgi:NADPH:quinone reductase-like Zn-dependent oxidoreductase
MLKAVRFSRFGDPEVLEIVDLPDPHPGPGQVRIAVRAAGVNPSDWKKRKGLMDGELPQTMGHEAAGVVDELGEGVAEVAVGDRVFGLSAEGAAQAELAVLSYYAPIPPSLDFPGAAALPAAIETATRALDQLGVGSGSTLLINGASGSVGSAAVQVAVVRGARVIGALAPPTRAQQSNTDQQMSFRNRWSSSTSSRISSGSWPRCHRHSSCPAPSPSPSGAPARAALIA